MKLSGILVLGFIDVFFIMAPIGWLARALPRYWIGKMMLEQKLVFGIMATVVSLVWIFICYGKLSRRIL